MENQKENQETIRLNKYIAHSGLCSRRAAADLVKAGKIKVNGVTELNPSYMVKEGDKVHYKSKLLQLEKNKIYLLLNKPKNVVTTLSDEKGRRTVMDVIKNKVEERIYPVGRLDRATTGLLLLTNDGELAKKLSHPSHNVKKIYKVTLDKALSKADLDKIRTGLTLEDGVVEVDKIDIIKGMPATHVGIEIHMGKNRIVRRIFEHLGYRVRQLDRVYYAGLTKKDLPRGWSRFLTKQEVIMLKHFT